MQEVQSRKKKYFVLFLTFNKHLMQSGRMVYGINYQIIEALPLTIFRKHQIDGFHLYCSQLKLNVNVDKNPKDISFSYGHKPKNSFYNNTCYNVVEIVNEIKYLSAVFSRSRSFYKAKKHFVEQTQKSMYIMIRIIRLFNLSIELEFDFV